MKLREWGYLWFAREEGATMAGYGVTISLLALACLVLASFLGTNLKEIFDEIVASLKQ